MNLPGSAKTHVWVGLLVALVGVLVGGYAYTGERIYRIEFLPLALLGLILVLGGSSLAGFGQANRPRLGGSPDEDDDGDGGPGLLERLRAWVSARTGSQQAEASGDADEAQAPSGDEGED